MKKDLNIIQEPHVIEMDHLKSERKFKEAQIEKLYFDLLDSSIPDKEPILKKIKALKKIVDRIHKEQSIIYQQTYPTV